MIKLRNISKTFKSNITFDAVKDVSLTINKGDIFGIIGSSGAGKSTLLKMMSGLMKPSSGQLFVNNKNIYTLSKHDQRQSLKDIGVVYQQFHLFMQKTVFKNVSLPLEIHHHKKDVIKARVLNLLKAFDLLDKKDNYPSQLSGGQQQRVAIARALAYQPNVLLLDEITSSLDVLTRNQILKRIKDIHLKTNITIIVITHDMGVVKKLCDKVAIIHEGSLIEQGDVNTVFKYPKKAITKQLLEASGYNYEQRI